MTIEQLYDIAADRNIEIDDFPLKKLRAVSISEGWIAIDRRKFASDTDYKCALAHEIGHCVTDSFYNLHTSVPVKELIERQANRYAAELLVPFSKLVHAVHCLGIMVSRTLAQMFDVTLEFIKMVLDLYEQELASPAYRRPVWITTARATYVGHQDEKEPWKNYGRL